MTTSTTTTTTFNFSANGINYGEFSASSQEEAQDKFAVASGYASWDAMVEQANEFGGNNVEIKIVEEEDDI
jgi:hypothetical protein